MIKKYNTLSSGKMKDKLCQGIDSESNSFKEKVFDGKNFDCTYEGLDFLPSKSYVIN